MKILFENPSLVIAVKPAGVLSEDAGEGSMVYELRLATGSDIYAVHRLDRAVGGVMAYAKTKEDAAALSREGALRKEYVAALHGVTDDEGEMRDLLFKDSRSNKSYVVKRMRRGVKEAALTYKTLERKEGISLVSVELLTGRSHQIRVQFASRRHPLVGDGKYGASDGCPVALFCATIEATIGNETVSAHDVPDNTVYPWNLFDTFKEG